MKSKMNLKFNLNTVNTILMVIILIVVIFACVRKYRENFDICHIPCNSKGDDGEWSDGDGQFQCGGPQCSDVSTIDAAIGRGADFGIVGDMIDSGDFGPERGLAGILHNIFLGALDADVWGNIEGGDGLWDGDTHVKTGLNKTATTGNEDAIKANIKILTDEIKKSDGFLDEVYILINEGEDSEKHKTLDKQAKINFRVVLGIDGYCSENTNKSFCVNLY